MTYIEILRAARARINQGWYQGEFWDNYPGPCLPTSKVCAYGAVQAVAPDSQMGSRVFDHIYDELDRMNESSLVKWNDRPERTKGEVLDLFDRVIARLEQR